MAPIIGIVTSAKFQATPLEQNFITGLRASGWEWDPAMPPGPKGRAGHDIREVLGHYGELNAAVRDLNGNADVAVIVAVGGLPAAHAAATLSTNKPFLVIMGAMPNFNLDPHGKLRGGVNLDIPAKNKDRNRFLHEHYGVQQNRVCLVYNPKNDDLSRLELQLWRPNGWPDEGVAGDNDPNYFAQAFKNAKQKADAVVISSDAFFTLERDRLVKAANDSGLNVCYPFEIYTSSNPPPAPGRSMWYGPDLMAAYHLAGEKTGKVLSDPDTSTGLDNANSEGPVFRDGP